MGADGVGEATPGVALGLRARGIARTGLGTPKALAARRRVGGALVVVTLAALELPVAASASPPPPSSSVPASSSTTTTTTRPPAPALTAPGATTTTSSTSTTIATAPPTPALRAPTAAPAEPLGPPGEPPPPPSPELLGPAPTPAPAGAQPPRSHLAQLLAASASARRALAVQVAEAEAALGRAEAGLSAARDELGRAEGRVAESDSQAKAATAGLERASDDVTQLALSVASLPAAGRSTPVAHPPARGRSAADEAQRLRAELRAAVARRDERAARAGEAQRQLAAARQAVTAAAEAVAVKSRETDQRRNVLDGLRQKAAAAEEAPGWAAAVLSAAAGPVEPSALALAEIPPDYLDLYRRAAQTCPGLSWTVLAAIGSVESGHGRSGAAGVRSGANEAGAMGPMQFLASTWASYGVDGGGDGSIDVYDPPDAVFGAARFLCAAGAGRLATLPDALWAYNHADWYVEQVLALAGAYGRGAPLSAPPADVAALVAHPNLVLSPQAADDLLAGSVDARLVGALAASVTAHRITVGVIRSGHAQFVRGTTRVSNHFLGRGVDIGEVDGVAVSAANDAALALALELLGADGPIRPDELGSPWPALSRFAGAFSDEDHADHLHLGWGANPPEAPATAGQP